MIILPMRIYSGPSPGYEQSFGVSFAKFGQTGAENN